MEPKNSPPHLSAQAMWAMPFPWHQCFPFTAEVRKKKWTVHMGTGAITGVDLKMFSNTQHFFAMKFTCRQKSNTRFKVSSNLGTFLAILSTRSQCKSTSLQWAIRSGKVCCAIEKTAVYKLHIQSWSALFLWSLLLYMLTTYLLPKTVQLQVAPLCSVWGFNYSYKFQIPTTTQRSPRSPERTWAKTYG
jgi:hypothetical protein